jgi:hypothetical protein
MFSGRCYLLPASVMGVLERSRLPLKSRICQIVERNHARGIVVVTIALSADIALAVPGVRSTPLICVIVDSSLSASVCPRSAPMDQYLQIHPLMSTV